MLMNQLKVALRHIGNNRVYSAINILGLGLGLACCILILLYVRFETGFDKQFANAERIYRVSREFFPFDGARARIPASTNAPMAPALLQDFPAIEAVGRFWGGNITLGRDELRFVEPGLRVADNTVFDIFNFEWLAGDKTQALTAPNSIVLTESLALKYFGRLDVLGQTLQALNDYEVIVTGVIRDLPTNTHLDFSGLLSINAMPIVLGPQALEQWNSNTDFHTYLLLRAGTDIADVANGIPAFLDRHAGENLSKLSTLPLMAIRDIHLQSRMDEEWKASGNRSTVYSFAAIAFGVLLIACINFMAIATARSAQRAKEIGMRLSMGASRQQLITQFLGESALTAVLAMFVATLLVELLMPTFRVFAGTPLVFDLANDLDLLLSMLALTVFVALFAGSYPALYLSAYKPARVLKGELSRGTGGSIFRNSLVLIQFAIAIALLIATAVIYQQRQLATQIELGFSKDNIVVLPSAAPQGYGSDWPTLKQELLKHPAIEVVSASHYLPFGFNDNQMQLRKRGSAVESRIQLMMVDYDFFETYGINTVAGRTFSATIASDALMLPSSPEQTTTISFILNQAAASALTIDNNLDAATLESPEISVAGPLVGIVEDTLFESIRRPARPMVYLLVPPQTPQKQLQMRNASIRLNPQATAAALAHIDAVWSRLYPGQANNRYFLDNDFQAMYQAEAKQGELFTVFATLAVLIACFGLFGLASYNAERRTKEIGVRKVLGGSVWSIVLLLTNDFSKLVLLSNLIAWPIAYYAMNRWLENFAYRIDLTPLIFIGSGLIALCIAWVTVGGTAAKAASQKPVLALRYE
jgi:putative ABC transport system permease protein